MGQYYIAAILGPLPAKNTGKEFIRAWLDPHDYSNGSKLMEHSYMNNQFVRTFEYLLSPEGPFWKSRAVWAGDYADPEPGVNETLYTVCHEAEARKRQIPSVPDMSAYRFIVNHTNKLVYDKNSVLESGRHNLRIHPLPLLLADGNGRGGGDYRGTAEDAVGSWAYSVISVEKELPSDPEYELVNYQFAEE